MRTEGGLVDAIDAALHKVHCDRIGVAVSGGSDSLALLHAAHAWGKRPVEAVTVDHGLRPEAADEARHVAEICAGLGVAHQTREWRGWDGKGNLQDQARRNRYTLIAEWARERSIGAVLLGHTLDDQAETFLMRLARRSGVDGLAMMRKTFEQGGVTFIRPFHTQPRDDLRAYLTSKGVAWIEDPSNDDPGFDRVKAREALGHLAPLGIDAEVLFDVSVSMSEARTALDIAAAEFALEKVRGEAGDLIFDRAALRRRPPEIVRRLLARALMFVSSAEYPPRRNPLQELETSIVSGENGTLHGCRVMVSDMTVRITREHAAVAETRGPTTEPWDRRWHLDGPHAPDLEVRALGEAVSVCPDWRATGLPRATLLASPSVWRGDTLVAAPLAGMETGWTARAPGSADFAAALFSH